MLLTDSPLRLSIKCCSCNTYYSTGYKIVLEQRVMHSDKSEMETKLYTV
jgi:hypothetical protein